MKKLILLLLGFLILIPLVRADVIVSAPSLTELFGSGGIVIFLIPIILIEGIIAYFFIKKIFNLKISFWYTLLIFLTANVISAIIGFLISPAIPSSRYTASMFELFIHVIPFYFATSIVEFPIIYQFIKNKTSYATTDSLKISLFVNIFSYALILIVLSVAFL